MLEHSEISGRATFSDEHLDTSKFKAIDHYCYTMWRVWSRNSHIFKGLFFKRPNIREHQKLSLIWAMLQTRFYENTPSRVKKREEAARKREAKATMSEAKRQKTISGSAGQTTIEQ